MHFFDTVVLKSKSAMVAFIRADPSAGAMQASLSVDANAARATSASASKSKSKRKLGLEIDPLLEVFNQVHFLKRELKAARASKSLIISLVVG